jgi:hypothetical protein
MPRKTRKKPEQKQEETKEDLKEKLKQKLKEKKLERTCRTVRDNMLEKLEDKLDNCRNPTERKKLKDNISVLEKIQEKEENFAGDFPEYGDGSTYGGSLDRSD